MKSVGEAMAIGRTFKEAFQKGLRGLETDRTGWVTGADRGRRPARRTSRSRRVLAALRTPTPERVFQIKRALQLGVTVEAVAERTRIDPWFLHQLAELLEAERGLGRRGGHGRRATTGDDERRGRSRRDEADGLLRPAARRPVAA